jgi:hypothetical protein
VLVDVHLHDLHVVLVGDPVENRRDSVARATPLGPEVDDHFAVRLEDFGFERLGRCTSCQLIPFV